jgi:hypothetical protein
MIAFLFIALAGVARAVHTARKDYGRGTRIYRYFEKSERFRNWYDGGNEFYPPGSIFTGDFWHVFVFVQVYCWVFAVVTAVFSEPSWWLIAALALCGSPVEGWFFTYFYHYVFPIKRDGNFWHFLKRVLKIR